MKFNIIDINFFKKVVNKHRLIKFIKEEPILIIFLFILFILSSFYPNEIKKYHYFIDWGTIFSLTGLLIIVTGIRESGYFLVISKRLLIRIKTERGLSFFLILISILFSTFLTNDITLFIVIPLTMSIQNLIKNNIDKLIIFEAIAVNVGSALTPIGNPQNLFLWHNWGISFLTFIIKMLPMVLSLFIILFLFLQFSFKDKKIEFFNFENIIKADTKIRLFVLSLSLLIVYLFSLEQGYTYFILVPIFIIYLIFYKSVLRRVDWLLIILFIVIFIDFSIIPTISFIYKLIVKINLQYKRNIFLLSAFISQIFSNVPGSVFISKFTNDWKAITYGVNVGGNGLVISSFANIIVLRMIRRKNFLIIFHKYSLVYFFISIVIIYLLFYVL